MWALALAHRPHGVGRNLARFELPLSADFGILIIIPPCHQPLLPIAQHAHFHITGPGGSVRTQQLNHMVMNEGAWLQSVQSPTDYLAQLCMSVCVRQPAVGNEGAVFSKEIDITV